MKDWSDIPQLMMSSIITTTTGGSSSSSSGGTTSNNNNSRRGSSSKCRRESDNNNGTSDNLESVIADAMKQLSMNDREKVVHSIHGVEDAIEETKEFLEQKLYEMNNELIQIKSSGGHNKHYPTAAIELAESISVKYVENPKFRLQFLRTENFDPKAAAIRMVNHFDFKFGLFGGSKLCKDITYDDLDEYDKEALEKGFLQVLPVRDRAGRVVCCLFPDKQRYNPNCEDIGSCFGRISWYTHNSVLDDKVSMSKGLVLIVYNVGGIKPEYLYPQVPPVTLKLMKCQPIKFVSIHMCFSNTIFKIALENFLKAVGGNIRTIAKIHHGSQTEVMYNLMTYGIPTDMIPVTFDDEIKRTNHMENIKMMKMKEEYIRKHTTSGSSSSTGSVDVENDNSDDDISSRCIVVPYVQDVLFGKGGPTTNSPGNMRLKSIVDELLPMYNTISKDEKIELSNQVLACIKESGGRFLSKDTGVWLVVDDKISRSKVATLFRNRRKAAAKKQKQQQQTKNSAPPTPTTSLSPPSSESIKSPIRSRSSCDDTNNTNNFLSSSNATPLNNGNKRLRI